MSRARFVCEGVWLILLLLRTPNSEFQIMPMGTPRHATYRWTRPGLSPYSDFTCACNVILLPKGMVRPTDNSRAIKAAFYRRYIELYGEETLIGRSGFKKDRTPDWYTDLKWNQPYLPPGWRQNTEQLLTYRTNRITHIMTK